MLICVDPMQKLFNERSTLETKLFENAFDWEGQSVSGPSHPQSLEGQLQTQNYT